MPALEARREQACSALLAVTSKACEGYMRITDHRCCFAYTHIPASFDAENEDRLVG
jgi:hypothetical protein